jgi:hypothetical protein
METHFSKFNGTWPNWEMWGLLAGTYDTPSVGGIMFDAAAAFGTVAGPYDRQGFAVFRNHGHAFNFLHSWDKNRPDALSWMNYDWKYDGRHGSDTFWKSFRMRFDDEELLHLRHGDRPAVMMGGDPWATGGHAICFRPFRSTSIRAWGRNTAG